MNPHAPFNFHMTTTMQTISVHPGPASSPSQSVPGRRTPLGTVGLGGFYAQAHSSGSSHASHHTDENRPTGSSIQRYIIYIYLLFFFFHLRMTRRPFRKFTRVYIHLFFIYIYPLYYIYMYKIFLYYNLQGKCYFFPKSSGSLYNKNIFIFN